MSTSSVLDAEEYIEQAYFFRTVRERLATNQATQDILHHVHEEILATTRLPMAIQFLATEMKHAGELSSGMSKLSHYFTPFQTFVVTCTEREKMRFQVDIALQVLEREALFRAKNISSPGLFIYQFEVISRNRLGYDEGVRAMAGDPVYDADWREYAEIVRTKVGLIDFTDLVYMRSEQHVMDQRRHHPNYEPSARPLFGLKEGRIAKANQGRDPLYLFAALQRQLAYPEVPRPAPFDDMRNQVETLKVRIRDMEKRLKLVENELAGRLDITQLGKIIEQKDDE